MSELQRLRRDHGPAVLAFEHENRTYFARSISDRGDDFFDDFSALFEALLAEQEAGRCVFYVLVDEDASVVGRFNLFGLEEGTADVGYRVAQRLSGHGLATSGLRNLCLIAAEEHGLRSLRAGTSTENLASQRVLVKAGFVRVGSTEVAGRQGVLYEMALLNLEQRRDGGW